MLFKKKKQKASDEKKNSVTGVLRSVRTQYTLATGLFLLMVMALFYIGGRIVLVHLVRDAEQQVREIGQDIKRTANKNAEVVRKSALQSADAYSEGVRAGKTPELLSLLGRKDDLTISLVIRFSMSGAFAEGVLLDDSFKHHTITLKDIDPYKGYIPEWAARFRRSSHPAPITGIMRVKSRTNYIALVPLDGTKKGAAGFLLIGVPFDSGPLAIRPQRGFGGADIRITNRKVDAPPEVLTVAQSRKKWSSGIAPLVSEAIDFYSGGFWSLDTNPFEALFTIRDISGVAVSMISVSLPKTFSSVTRTALGRLTLFISMGGILLILPVFWFQSKILLNPLTEMTRRIRAVSLRRNDADCPRIEWHGDDEFAQLAVSVNRMLEALSQRAVAIGQIESRQKALINGLPDGLAVFDKSHKLVTLSKEPENAEPLQGFIEGTPIDVTVFGREGVELFGKAVDLVFAKDEIRQIRLTAQSAYQKREFEIRISSMDAHFALAIIRDITVEVAEHAKRIAAEGRLAHSRKQESLTLLAGGIAHDMNNVLAAVLNTAEITWMDDKDDVTREAVETIRDAVRRGSAMTRELMTFAGETKMSFKRTELSVLINEARRLAKSILPPGISVVYHLGENLPAVDADANQIWKVFFNLAKNASESMEGKGQITISTEAFVMTPEAAESYIATHPIAPGPGVLFKISDTGPGIPTEIRRRIFDPYVSTKSTGRGFGLPTVCTIVDAHNGGIAVTSEVGHGTTFLVYLPESKLLPVETNREAAPSVQDVAAGEILLVDDDPNILKTTAILLKILKRTVHTAATHHDALNIFRRRTSNLACVILDAHLGETDTPQTIAAFRATAPEIPIIVASGSAREQIEKLFIKHPFNAFLSKPYTLDEMKDLLNRFAKK